MRVTPSCDSINSFYISNASGVQLSPDIAFGGGYYFAVWSDNRAGYYQIYGARITTSGTVLDPNGILIGPSSGAYYYYPSIIFNGNNFLVIWSVNTTPYRVMGRFVNPNGSFASDTLRLANASNYVYRVRHTFSGSNYLVCWAEYSPATYTYSVKGQIVSNTGVPVGSPFNIADSVQYTALSVRWAVNNYLVAFSRRVGSIYQICGRFINTSGQPVGGIFNISNNSYNCYYNDLYMGSGNRFLNVWSEYRTNNYDIYGNLDLVIGVEENKPDERTYSGLRSTVITKTIEFSNAEINGEIYDVSGKLIGNLENGRYDCSKLNAGIYFVRTDKGERFKFVKIK